MLKFFVSLFVALSSISILQGSNINQIKASVAEGKPFVTVGLLGGLGNRLFEVATACALAWDNGAEPCFPELARTPVDFKHIFYRCKVHPLPRNVEFEWGTSPYGYTPVPYHPNMKLQGYFQNEKYFAHHRDRIVKLFTPNTEDLNYINRHYGKYLNQDSVSVHLRYYIAEKPGEDSFIQYDREYFEKAMALFPNTSIFIVTTDNLKFARENIPTEGRRVVFVEGEPYYIDFFIQSLCKHNIICNSTFSWWSAWLNQNPNKVVVRPKVWMGGYPDIGGPDSWIKIDAEGMQSRLKRI